MMSDSVLGVSFGGLVGVIRHSVKTDTQQTQAPKGPGPILLLAAPLQPLLKVGLRHSMVEICHGI